MPTSSTNRMTEYNRQSKTSRHCGSPPAKLTPPWEKALGNFGGGTSGAAGGSHPEARRPMGSSPRRAPPPARGGSASTVRRLGNRVWTRSGSGERLSRCCACGLGVLFQPAGAKTLRLQPHRELLRARRRSNPAPFT